MKRRRKFYCWLNRPGEWCLGRHPPDSPSMPYQIFAALDDVERAIDGWRVDVVWCGGAAEMRAQLRPAKEQ